MEEPIKIENATLCQGRVPILKDIDLTVHPGEFVFLIGRTGAGKSTLLKSLYGEIPVTEGKVQVGGFEMNGLKESKIPYLRRELGIVFQDFQLLNDRSAIDNLLFVLKATGWKKKDVMIARCEQVLQVVGLENKGYKFPAELSGGEQQRLVIARALLNEPKLVLADEPTGSLDPTVSDEVMALLQKICSEGTSILMATHDYRLIQKFGGTIYEVKDQNLNMIPDVTHLSS
ncbi:MAG: ATP-binding cassette domain-containing protein [Bacteroidia bacterium]|nr:ATP-binding cassette domain-containing protein [Bacteroidia bacterium]